MISVIFCAEYLRKMWRFLVIVIKYGVSETEDEEERTMEMKLRQAKGNTWYLEDWQLIPLYRTDPRHCILIDSGDLTQRDSIWRTLEANGIRPVGILGTHVHTDHSVNHGFLKEKYQIPLALPAGEAAICASSTMLKAYYYMVTEGQIHAFEDYSNMLVNTEYSIPAGEETVTFCGADFRILRTPGHSPDHISVITPDNVLCTGDALFSSDYLEKSKLPYFFSLQTAIDSMRALKRQKPACCIMAHCGVTEALLPVIEDNIRSIDTWAQRILTLAEQPLTVSEYIAAVCKEYSLLSSRLFKTTLYERNIRVYIEYLTDSGKLTEYAEEGMTYYVKSH